MDLVKWIQKQKKHSNHVDDEDDDDFDDANVTRSRARQYRSRSVDPTSPHYIAAQTYNLAHHSRDQN